MGCHFTKPNSSRVSLLTFSVSVCFFPFLWSSALRSAQVWSVLPSVPLVVLWFPAWVALRGSWDCVGFVLLLVRLLVFLVLLRSSLCLGGPCCFLCCLPSFVVVPFSVLVAFPPPRVVLFGALVQLVPWFAGTSLWVSGCSCDGLVALLSCWECGWALPSFRHSSHGNKGYWPCGGFSPSTPCHWWRQGA